jgi:ABC-type multidrug transport system fused ATPase/permease subunit
MFAGAPADRLVRHSPIYLDAPPPETGTPETVPPFEGLEVEGLTCRYPRSQKGIAGASLAVRPGELVVITGRVGSGKTTLVRGLLGAAPRQAGEIRWDGSLVDDPRTFFGPPRTAYVPQVPVLFSDTLRGNVLLGWPDEERLDHALQLSAFEEDLRHMSQGLDTLVGARGLKLSGGQQHRVAAARAFVRAPQLLVIDDLSSAVDVETEAAIWEGLLAEPGLTCLVISHRRTALQRADRIVVLRDGAVEDTGKLDDLLERSAELRAIYFHEQEENAPD